MSDSIEDDIRAAMSGHQNSTSEPRDLRPYLKSATDLVCSDIPPKKLLVSTFIPLASLNMVFAPRGIGKSWFAMGLAKAIAKGEPTFLGWKIHESGHVLFVDGEMALVDLKERLLSLFGEQGCANFHLLPSEDLYKDGCPICLDKFQEQEAILNLLENMRATGVNPKLIVLDNLSTLRRGVNENDNSEAQVLLDFLVKLRHLGYCVLLIHHTNKGGEQRGASILEVPQDSIIKLSPPPKTEVVFNTGACFNVELTKIRNRAPLNREVCVKLLENEAGFVDFTVDNIASEIPLDIILLRVLAENKCGLAQRELAKKLGISLGKINSLIKTITEEGLYDRRTKCILSAGNIQLHQYFPEVFPEPDGYQEYTESFPF